MKGIGILPGNNLSYMDHLVPLCQVIEVPILVTDPWMKELIEIYYPPMEVRLAETEDFLLDPFLKGYEVFFYVDFFRQSHGVFQFKEYLCRQKGRSVMSLHGNPDKYRDIYWIEKLCDEDIVLAYGPQLLELMRQKNLRKQPIICGNYRLEYYKTHAQFFQGKIPFKKEKMTVLYAPTWASSARHTEHRTQYTSFLEVYDAVFKTLTREFQLIVKLHPHMVLTMGERIEQIEEAYPHIYFLKDFPLIYPLLDQMDLYLGDYSSIGYDFLYFDRPLFFLETQERTPLHTCGMSIGKEDLPKLKDLSQTNFPRKKLYHETFGETKELKVLKKEIEDAYRSSAG